MAKNTKNQVVHYKWDTLYNIKDFCEIIFNVITLVRLYTTYYNQTDLKFNVLGDKCGMVLALLTPGGLLPVVPSSEGSASRAVSNEAAQLTIIAIPSSCPPPAHFS